MRPTRIPTLLAVAVACGAVAFVVVRFAYTDLPALPWTVVVTPVVIALAELVLARSVRARIHRRPGAPPLEALVVARYAAFAKASAYAAAVVAGVFGGLLTYVLAELQTPTERVDALVSAFAVLAAAGLVAAALALEHACRVPDPPEKEQRRPVEHR